MSESKYNIKLLKGLEMNPNDFLPIIEKAIASRTDGNGKMFHLCFWEGKIQCCHLMHTLTPHRIFCTLTNSQCVNGLTAAKWDMLTQSVAEHYRKEALCPEQ